MTGRVIRYSVGNEHNPGDPWGRSELVIQPDGAVRLDHHFSRIAEVRAWTARVEEAALDALWTALERAGFPEAPLLMPVAGASLRRLTVDADGVSRQAVFAWHDTASLPGYADAFDILDGVVRQISGETVAYPTTRSALVGDITAVSDSHG